MVGPKSEEVVVGAAWKGGRGGSVERWWSGWCGKVVVGRCGKVMVGAVRKGGGRGSMKSERQIKEGESDESTRISVVDRVVYLV